MVHRNMLPVASRGAQEELVGAMELFSHRHASVENGGWNGGITNTASFTEAQFAAVTPLYVATQRPVPRNILVVHHQAEPQETGFTGHEIVYMNEKYPAHSMLCGAVLNHKKLRAHGMRDFTYETSNLDAVLAESEVQSQKSRFSRLLGIKPKERNPVSSVRADFLLRVIQTAHSIYGMAGQH